MPRVKRVFTYFTHYQLHIPVVISVISVLAITYNIIIYNTPITSMMSHFSLSYNNHYLTTSLASVTPIIKLHYYYNMHITTSLHLMCFLLAH